MTGRFSQRNRGFLVLAAVCSLIAAGCSTSSSDRNQSREQPSGRYANGSQRIPVMEIRTASTDGNTETIALGVVASRTSANRGGNGETKGETEFWLFGPIGSPELTKPLGATGVRTILDLRNLPMNQAEKFFSAYADRGLGLALCLRWRNPTAGKIKVEVFNNYDVSPTPAEAEQAISDLKKLFASAAAKRLGDRLFVQFYNEVGGGPGTLPPDQADELFAFATRAVSEIRAVNSQLRICGPAVTGGQLQPNIRMNAKLAKRAAVIKQAIAWSAAYADAIDLHLHGVDGSWSRPALERLRSMLDQTPRGKTVRILSFEWSCARYPDRENAAGVRNALMGIWKTLNDFDLICAAYGPYWPLKNKANDKVADRFGWVSIVDSNGRRNQPIFDTLQKIGGGDGIDEPKKKRRRLKNDGN